MLQMTWIRSILSMRLHHHEFNPSLATSKHNTLTTDHFCIRDRGQATPPMSDMMMHVHWSILTTPQHNTLTTDHFCIRGPCTPPMPGTMMSIRFLWSMLVIVSLGSSVVGVAWLSVGVDMSSHSGNMYCSCDSTSLASSRASKIPSSSVSNK